ncbi:MAG: hypothetical protein KME04_10915 [Pleurocapsa minor GSE-CHR-MK-17-07R]|jgi:hypothetical protein|nr:hypothetical protein [Pleurocapsa minor GSE-CHR-MK 17-07R]
MNRFGRVRLRGRHYLAGMAIGALVALFSLGMIAASDGFAGMMVSLFVVIAGLFFMLGSAMAFYRAHRQRWYMRMMAAIPRLLRGGAEVVREVIESAQSQMPDSRPDMQSREQYAPRYGQPSAPSTRFPMETPSRPQANPSFRPGGPSRRPDTLILDNGVAAYTHALRAASAAGLDAQAAVIPIDLGFKVMSDGALSLVRDQAITRDADSLQPYVRLHLAREAHGLIRFELIDPDGQKLFMHDTLVSLGRGEHLVSPSSRLKVLDSFNFSGPWKLRVYADTVLLVEHSWQWGETRREKIQQAVTSDGEIHAEVRARLEETDLFERVSLEDLLGDQDSFAQDDAAQRRAAGRS